MDHGSFSKKWGSVRPRLSFIYDVIKSPFYGGSLFIPFQSFFSILNVNRNLSETLDMTIPSKDDFPYTPYQVSPENSLSDTLMVRREDILVRSCDGTNSPRCYSKEEGKSVLIVQTRDKEGT